MHNALNTRKIAFHEHWKRDMKEWHSENADFFLYSEGFGYWGGGKFLRVLDLDSFRRVWHANQLHVMFDDFFWNSFLGLLVSFSCFTISENGFFHYLLCIPIYHCGVFLSISPLSSFGLISLFTVVDSYPKLSAKPPRWPDAYHNSTSVVHLILLVFFFLLWRQSYLWEVMALLIKLYIYPFPVDFEILKISTFSGVKEIWYMDLCALLFSVLRFGVENKKLVLA